MTCAHSSSYDFSPWLPWFSAARGVLEGAFRGKIGVVDAVVVNEKWMGELEGRDDDTAEEFASEPVYCTSRSFQITRG